LFGVGEVFGRSFGSFVGGEGVVLRFIGGGDYACVWVYTWFTGGAVVCFWFGQFTVVLLIYSGVVILQRSGRYTSVMGTWLCYGVVGRVFVRCGGWSGLGAMVFRGC
jgi:hypothetical protein